jgi:diguanylate cyclase (GGDEF)-like protein
MLKRDAATFETLLAILESAGEAIVAHDERGELLYFNPTAERILRLDLNRASPAIWTGAQGLFYPDRETPFPPEQSPLTRALAGESTTNVEIFIRHAQLREGVFVRATGRPILDNNGARRGAVVTFRDVTELRLVRDTAQRLATTDPLTEIANRRAFNERMAELLAEANRGRQIALALIDLDSFKEVNDAYGHQLGDEVLVAVAAALQQAIRRTDFVARIGGDEFCVLLTDMDEELAATVCGKLQDAVHSADRRVDITASVGVAAYRRGSVDTADALMHGADAALYQAKAAGGARVVAYSDVPAPEVVLATQATKR